MEVKMPLNRFSSCFSVLLVACFLAGCYESGNGNEDAVSDTAADEVTDTGGDMHQDPDAVADPDLVGDPDGSGEIVCQYGEPFVAQFDKTCSGAEDCGTVYFALDCCGTTLAAGVILSEEDRFNHAWAECVMELPMCGCPSGPPVAEDGNSTMSLEDIEVDCMGGSCMTYVP
jgi:hypothetical protein